MGPERREGACERSEQADDRSEGHPAGRRYPSVRQKADLFCKANLPDRGVPRPAVQPTDTTKPGNTPKPTSREADSLKFPKKPEKSSIS